MKVLTWNVNCSNGASIERQKQLVNLIFKVDPDIFLLNEYNQDLCPKMDSLLKRVYPYTAEAMSHQRNGDIFYCKHLLEDIGSIDTIEPDRQTSLLKAKCKVGSQVIRFVGCHLVSNNGNGSIDPRKFSFLSNLSKHISRFIRKRKRRIWQAECIAKTIESTDDPIILMGDFNDFANSKPLRIIQSCGLKNAWSERRFGLGNTFHQGLLRLRLDHIFHSPVMKLCWVEVINTNLSDHNPVVARLEI